MLVVVNLLNLMRKNKKRDNINPYEEPGYVTRNDETLYQNDITEDDLLKCTDESSGEKNEYGKLGRKDGKIFSKTTPGRYGDNESTEDSSEDDKNKRRKDSKQISTSIGKFDPSVRGRLYSKGGESTSEDTSEDLSMGDRSDQSVDVSE